MFGDFIKFRERVRLVFKTINNKKYAVRVIQNFRQTFSAFEYITKFEKYIFIIR